MESVVDWPEPPALEILLRQRWGDDWLVGLESAVFWQQLEQAATLLQQAKIPQAESPGSVDVNPRWVTPAAPALLIVEPDPLGVLVSVLAGLWQGYTVVLANPQWGDREMQQVQAIARPEAKPCLLPWAVYLAHGLPPTPQPEILIATGGTSGRLKFARHTWITLMASVQGFLAHFGTATANAYCVLPLYHVSGLMQALRVLASGGTLALQAYSALKQGQFLPFPAAHPTFLSLVPTQLQWFIAQSDSQDNPFLLWLREFRAVLLGGAPAWPALISVARSHRIPVALTYGMTETASQVSTLLPEDFLAGNTSSGQGLPHAQIQVWDDRGQPLAPHRVGRLAIAATSLLQGYRTADAPATPAEFWRNHRAGFFLTDDLGYWDDAGYLHLVGRHSTTIITGGEKVFPEEVEAVLLATGLVRAACVVGLSDGRWGQVVWAAVVPQRQSIQLDALPQALQGALAAYKRPKGWLLLSTMPTTPQGKVDRGQVLTLAQTMGGQDH